MGGYLGQKPTRSPLTTADLSDDLVTSAKIADGAVTDVKVAALTASKLTGALPAISGANLTGIAVTTDLTSVHQGIATLGLHMGVADNKAAFNLPNAFIDTFEDNTGITTETNVDRNASEYVSTAVSTTTLSALTDMGSANFTGGGGTVAGWTWGTGASSNDLTPWNGSHEVGGTTDGASTPIVFPASTEFEFHWYPAATSGYGPYVGIVPSSYSGTNDVNSTTNVMGTTGAMAYVPAASNYLRYNQSGSSSNVLTADYINTNCKFVRDSSNYIKFYSGGVLRYTSAATHSDAYEICISAQGGNASTASNLQYKITTTVNVTNATGTLISDAQTAAESTTEVSGVILYTDNAGTNTLGTDLKIYFTANNGGAWTEAVSYGASQVFSGSIKQVKLGKTTVTAGTQIAIKAVWANQVATVAGAKYSVTSGMMSHTNMSGWNAGEVVDGAVTDGTGFFFASSNSTGEVRVDLGSSNDQTFNKIRVYISAAVNAAVWTIAYSDDNSSWTNTDLTTFAPGAGSFGAWFEGTWTNVGTHRYWKMFVSSGTGAGQGWASEIEWHTAEVTGKVAHLEGWAVNY